MKHWDQRVKKKKSHNGTQNVRYLKITDLCSHSAPFQLQYILRLETVLPHHYHSWHVDEWSWTQPLNSLWLRYDRSLSEAWRRFLSWELKIVLYWCKKCNLPRSQTILQYCFMQAGHFSLKRYNFLFHLHLSGILVRLQWKICEF